MDTPKEPLPSPASDLFSLVGDEITQNHRSNRGSGARRASSKPSWTAPKKVIRTSALWHLPTIKLLMQMETPDTPPVLNAPQMAGYHHALVRLFRGFEQAQKDEYAHAKAMAPVNKNSMSRALAYGAAKKMTRDELVKIGLCEKCGGPTGDIGGAPGQCKSNDCDGSSLYLPNDLAHLWAKKESP